MYKGLHAGFSRSRQRGCECGCGTAQIHFEDVRAHSPLQSILITFRHNFCTFWSYDIHTYVLTRRLRRNLTHTHTQTHQYEVFFNRQASSLERHHCIEFEFPCFDLKLKTNEQILLFKPERMTTRYEPQPLIRTAASTYHSSYGDL
jgi:hypothetical protein